MRGRGFDSWAVNNSYLFRVISLHFCPRGARLLFLGEVFGVAVIRYRNPTDG